MTCTAIIVGGFVGRRVDDDTTQRIRAELLKRIPEIRECRNTKCVRQVLKENLTLVEDIILRYVSYVVRSYCHSVQI